MKEPYSIRFDLLISFSKKYTKLLNNYHSEWMKNPIVFYDFRFKKITMGRVSEDWCWTATNCLGFLLRNSKVRLVFWIGKYEHLNIGRFFNLQPVYTVRNILTVILTGIFQAGWVEAGHFTLYSHKCTKKSRKFFSKSLLACFSVLPILFDWVMDFLKFEIDLQ